MCLSIQYLSVSIQIYNQTTLLYTRNTVNQLYFNETKKTNKKIKGTLEDVQISEDGRGGAVLASEEVLLIQRHIVKRRTGRAQWDQSSNSGPLSPQVQQAGETRSEEKDGAGPAGSEQQ